MYGRLVEPRVSIALTDTPVVLVAGPRRAGKTTLVKAVEEGTRAYLTLGDQTVLTAAKSDPAGFIRGIDRATIDEIQRAPDLLLAVKKAVDEDDRAGRFLLTGSANVMTLPRVADSLAGRIEIVRLMPLARVELEGRKSGFLERLFSGRAPGGDAHITGGVLTDLVLAGGFPEALARGSERRRQDWARSYLASMKLMTWSDLQLTPYHFRDQQMHEVDLVLERDDGRVVGIEVKASATVTASDFSGLRVLAQACGDRFAFGVVLHDGDSVVPFGERLAAAPLSSLWQ